MVTRLAGIDVIASAALPSHRLVVDTSKCRSPARAKRRFNKRGIVGRIQFRNEPDCTVYMIGNKAFVNDLTYDALKKMIDELPEAPSDPMRDFLRQPAPKFEPEPEPLRPMWFVRPMRTQYGILKTVIDC